MRAAIQDYVQHSATLSTVRRSAGHGGPNTSLGSQRMAECWVARQGRYPTSTTRVCMRN